MKTFSGSKERVLTESVECFSTNRKYTCKSIDNYYNLKFSLEDIFKRNVVLLEENTIRNPYFLETLNKSKKLIYG